MDAVSVGFPVAVSDGLKEWVKIAGRVRVGVSTTVRVKVGSPLSVWVGAEVLVAVGGGLALAEPVRARDSVWV